MATRAGSSRLHDSASGYGWISIALHWATGVIVVVLLFVGSSIAGAEAQERTDLMRLHVSIALAAYALLWWRIAWRFKKGHPGPLPKQRPWFFRVGKVVHIAMLVAMVCMLLSGPLMVWSEGAPLAMFGWFEIPSPLPRSFAARDLLHAIHANAAIVIVVGLVLHLGGVYKHAAFDQDGTFAKMLVPPGVEQDSTTSEPPKVD